MDPRDFLALAERLVIEGAKPANLRSATSRAYYATHHFGAKVLRGLNLRVLENQHAHREVVDLLQHAGDEDVESIATQLDDLYAARRKADYELTNVKPEKLDTVRGHVTQARKIIARLEVCLTEPKRSKVSAAILAWDNQRKSALARITQSPNKSDT